MKFPASRAIRVVASCLLLAALAGCSQQELYGQLNEPQANEMVAALRTAGLDAEKSSSRDGKSFTVSTNAHDFARAVEVLHAGGFPRDSFDSLGQVFKKEGFVSSPLEERARFTHALSQELSNTLSHIDGVVQARVLVSVPETNSLADKPAPATASVFIKHRPGIDLSREVGKIKALVVNAVEGLPYDKVTVEMFPADPLPPTPPRSALLATWSNYGTLFLIGCGIGIAALLAGLAMWMHQRHARRAHDDGEQPSMALETYDDFAQQPSLRAVGLSGSRASRT
jgi:type III secretion protein J